MLSMLAQGNTGDEILSILDTLTADNIEQTDDNGPTLNSIEFWYSLCALWLTLGGTYVMLGDNSDPAVFCAVRLYRRGGVAVYKNR